MNDWTYERLKVGGRHAQSGGSGAVNRAAGVDCSRRGARLRCAGRRPGPRQLGQARARPALGQPVYDVGEIGLRVEPAELGRLCRPTNYAERSRYGAALSRWRRRSRARRPRSIRHSLVV